MSHRRPPRLGPFLAALTTVTVLGSGWAVELPSLFTDGAVLQRDRPVPIWGTARPGEAVTVSFAGQTLRTTADAKGDWSVLLAPMPASPVGRSLTVNEVERRDLLVGEVWVCCGQSNMEMPVGNGYRPKVYPGMEGFAAAVAAADLPSVRLFRPDHQTARRPLRDLPPTRWERCTPATVGRFSAVGFCFARDLHRALGVPVGVIAVAKSSTTVAAWSPTPAGAAAPPPETATEADDPATPPKVSFAEPGALYNGMVAPLMPFAVRGIAYYQGESDAKDPDRYRSRFPALITAWRSAWGQQDLPFLFVQLANFGGRSPNPGDGGGWARQREAQAAALALPRTGMVVTIDIGHGTLIHPPNKAEVGRRLSVVARAVAYGELLPARGPVFAGMDLEGHRVRVRFTCTDGGLKSRSDSGDHPAGFAIAGKDGLFHPAEALIEGDTVVVQAAAVPDPRHLRYAFAGNPQATLVNGAGLPAEPFRTDGPARAGP